MNLQIIKRTGETEAFKLSKVQDAIGKAMLETDKGVDSALIQEIAYAIEEMSRYEELTVEKIQDEVEALLMSARPDVAKRYIIYRDERTKAREAGWVMSDLQRGIWENKYRFEDETFEAWLERVSGGNQRIKKRIRNKEFLFGGRILANRGLQHLGYKVTYSNCYVLPRPDDNIESIWNTARDMARTYSYGGGVGISINNLRPEGAKVHNNARNTSGAPSFMQLYSTTTGTIGQKGRRGALMISLRSSHPDLEYFVDIKTQEGSVDKANVSIEIDNQFMIAVRENKPYRLHFTVEDTGEVIEKYIDAKAVYLKVIANNLDWAEPGMLYWDRISNYHLMSNHPDFEFHGVNPCAEEPLPPGGSCLLGSLNLAEFVIAPFTENARFDFNRFTEAVHDAVEALNEVLDEGLPLHPLEIQRKTVKELRQIGLGVMGIADMLIMLNMTYGSTKSLALNEAISQMLLVEAVIASSNYAKENGSFDWYDYDTIADSMFFATNIPTDVKELVKEQGLANSQILCIAPTGSISTMIGVSGGIEPIFALSYNRTTESLHNEKVTYKVYTDIVKQFTDATGTDPDRLPETFITSHTLGWKERIEMQAVWQKHIDASISSTINLANHVGVEETENLYMYAWELGLKGCTIYRDGCKRSGILTLDADDEVSATELEDTTVAVYEVEKATGFYSTCPECKGEQMVVANGCVTCMDCGFSPC